MQVIMRLLIYIYAIVIILIGRRISKSVLHPIRLFVLFWTLLIVFAISWWGISYRWNGIGLLWLETALLSTEIGSIILSTKNKSLSFSHDDDLFHFEYFDREYNWTTLYILIIFSFLGVILSLSLNGFHLSDITSVESIFNISSEMTLRRYSSSEESNLFQKIFSICESSSVLCGGYAINYVKKEDKFHKVICCLPFVPIVLSVLLTTAKSGMIASAILFVAGWSISRLRISGDFLYVDSKLLIKLAMYFLVLLLFLNFIMYVRVVDFSEGMRKIINEKFFVYGFGGIVEFDGWFAGGEEFHNYQLGSNTYMVLPRMIGLLDRQQGVYESYVYGFGNVFTAFRGIISDYGIIGGLIFCFIRGFVTHLCCIRVSRNPNKCYFSMCLLACQFFFGLYGFIISPWIYTTYVLGMFVFLLFMPLFDRRIRFGGKQKK